MSVRDTSLGSFLDDLAARRPTPGGGSAAAAAGALAAALHGMVANYTTGKVQPPATEAQLAGLLAETEALRTRLTELIDADMAAYEGVAAAYRLPKGTPEDQTARAMAIQQALQAAAQPPAETMRACHRVLELATPLLAMGNPRLASDVGVAATLAEAALAAAWLNVAVNLAAIEDDRVAAGLRSLEPLLSSAKRLREDVWGQVVNMVGR